MTLGINTIHQMDAIEGLRKINDNSVDLIITDPPYNVASPNRRTFSRGKPVRTSDKFGHWDTLHPFDHELLMLQTLTHAYRVLKPGRSLYLFAALQQQGLLIGKAIERGFVYRNHLVIIKKNPLPQLNSNNWRNAFELCVYFTKGKAGPFNFPSQQECVNVFPYAIGKKQSTHPTEKPVAFIERLVQVGSNKGDLVVDPFMGSEITAVASAKLGRKFIGFERESDYIAMARKRLREVA